ncbi:MAG TPA: thiamine-phosphate kinase [Desulfosalsimonadaceae bacterium]|nr:thiamine-phosphate kinase [Desulfosalsimonadaceae bacterium]
MKPWAAENLRFYFITDDQAPELSFTRQVETAIAAGAACVQYRNKNFNIKDIPEIEAIRDICRRHRVPFLINDDVLLTKAVDADGVHLGQTDASPQAARDILGPSAIIGVSVSTPDELAATDLSSCNYIGTGPVFVTSTKADAKPVIGLSGLKKMAESSPLPVVAIGGVNAQNVADCMAHGASGGAVISTITRAVSPSKAAAAFARASGAKPRKLLAPWADEFSLIDAFLSRLPADDSIMRVPAGDDAALLNRIDHPVITTDTQREFIHFRRQWQTMAEIGQKAVEITFSDLAAAYAQPRVLFVNLGLPPYMAEVSVFELYDGIRKGLDRHGACLGGGNLSGARELTIDLFAVGSGRPDLFPRRENARPGEGVYVTGSLGLARAGLKCLAYGDPAFPDLINRFKSPRARMDAARILADHGVASVMDLSDGLAGDAAHLAKAANLSISFTSAEVPIEPRLAEFCHKYGLSAHGFMFAGGEDYELLFTCPTGVFREIRHYLPSAFQVGQCLPLQDMYLINLPADAVSYQHGQKIR